MASIHKKFGSPYWYCQFRAAGGMWLKKSTKLRDRRRALEWCQALQRAQDLIGAGTPPESQLRNIISETMLRIGHDFKTPTVRSWFAAWLDARKGTAPPSTIAKYSTAVTSFLEHLGPRAESRLETIVQSDITAFRDALLASGLTPPTVNQIILRVIGSGFTLAFRQGIIRHNPLAGMRPLKDPGGQRKQAFSLEDVRKLLAASTGDWRGMVLLGYSSGMRIADAANLRWENVDLEQGVLSFEQRKTGQATIVGLHEDFREWLLSQPRSEEGPIFKTLAGVRTPGRGGLSLQFSAIMEKARIISPEIRTKRGAGQTVRSKSFHSFRHHVASAILRSKVVEATQKAVTGHAGDAVRRYTHHDIEIIRNACALIPRI